MKILLRSLIAFPLFAVLWSSVGPAAHAAKDAARDAVHTATMSGVGFLDLKTFLIGPTSGDDPALANDRTRVISPETLLYEQARQRPPDPLADYGNLLSSVSFGKPAGREAESYDTMTVEVNGEPMTLSLGLREAIRQDLHDGLHLYGVSGLFSPAPGAAAVGFIGRAADEVARRIDVLETMAKGGATPPDMSGGLDRSNTAPEPSSLLVFGIGLLTIAWLRRS